MITREQAEAYAKCGDCKNCAVYDECFSSTTDDDRRYLAKEILALMDEGPGVWKDAPANAERAEIYWSDVNRRLVSHSEIHTRTTPKTHERIAAEEKASRMVGKTAEEIADILMESSREYAEE